MNFIHLRALSILSTLLVLGVNVHAEESVDEIIDASIKASGGYEAIDKVKSLSRSGDVSMTIVGQNVTGSTEVAIVPWQKFNEVTNLSVFTLERGWNGTIGWQNGPQGLKKMLPEELALARFQAALNPLLGHRTLRLLGFQISKLGDEKIDDRPQTVIKVTIDENSNLDFDIDKQTRLLTRMTFNRKVPQLNFTVSIDIDYRDYKEFDGIKLPTKVSVVMGDLFKSETVYKETKLNGAVNDKIFEMPVTENVPADSKPKEESKEPKKESPPAAK